MKRSIFILLTSYFLLLTVHGQWYDNKTFTFNESSALSDTVDLGTQKICTLVLPANIDGASITFVGGGTDTTMQNLYDWEGSELTATIAENTNVKLDLTKFVGIRYLQLRTGTSATPVVQDTATTVIGERW